MDAITFNFYYKRKYWLARIIRWATKGQWNHVSITIGNVTWEAIGLRLNRVVCSHSATTFHKGKHKADSIESVEIKATDSQISSAIEMLKSFEGVKYDKFGALTFLSPLFNQRGKDLFCSELAAKVCAHVLGFTFSDKLISPSELYDIIKNVQLKTT